MNREYKSTVFHFIPDGKPSEFWIITAWNPEGRDAPIQDNRARDHRLRSILAERGLYHFRVIGTSVDEDHIESGWGLVTDEGTAIELGQRFAQEAVFHIRGDAVDLISCLTRARSRLPGLQTLLRDPRNVRLFTLSVGSPPSGNFDAELIQSVRELIQSTFADYTLRRAEGCFENYPEEVLLIDIGTRDYDKVLVLAHALSDFLKQTGAGISCNGVYQRVREWTDDELILESFGLT
jgi:hypothetical protein